MDRIVKSVLLTVFLVSVSFAQSTTQAPTDAAYIQLRSLKLSGQTVTIENLLLRRDAATFLLRRGEFHLAEPVNGKVVAAVFLGSGEFFLRPPTVGEQRNLAIFTKEPTLTESFSELVLHFTDSTYDEIVRVGSVAKKPIPLKAAAALKDREDLLRKGRRFLDENIAVFLLQYNLPARLLADLYDPEHAGFFNAFIKGERFEDLMFRVDPRGVPLVEPEEVVLVSFDDKTLGIWNAFRLQSLKAPGQRDEDNQVMDIEHQSIRATIDGTVLRAKVRTRFRLLVDGSRTLHFNLYGTLRVTKVREESGAELPFVQESTDKNPGFSVIFPKPLQRGLVTLEFEYAGDGAIAREGTGNYTLEARENWYPFSTFGDRATYDMEFRIPKDLVLVASGEPQGSSQVGDEIVSSWSSDVPLAVAGFNLGRFKKTEIRDERLKYVIESYANQDPTDLLSQIRKLVDIGTFDTIALMDKARDEARISMSIYQNYFGPLPYGRLAMTQQAAPNFGQAWPMLIYMPITAYLDSTHRNEIGFTGAEDFFKIVGPHEVAHQWWGHIVGWKSYRDQWMSEGFAEFSASLFAHLVYGQEQFLDFWKDQRRRILERNESGRRPVDVASLTMGYRSDNARTGYVARNLIYPKGAFILHMIRMMMYDHREASDARFMAMMRDFVKTHYNQNVSTEDFKRAVEKHMTADMDAARTKTMDWFFDQYVYGTAIPTYKLDSQFESSGNQTTVRLRVTQSDVPDNFRMVVPIYFERDDKRIGRIGAVTLVGNSSQNASVTLAFRPKRILLNAFEDVLANIEGE
jgi:hypothetical protein